MTTTFDEFDDGCELTVLRPCRYCGLLRSPTIRIETLSIPWQTSIRGGPSGLFLDIGCDSYVLACRTCCRSKCLSSVKTSLYRLFESKDALIAGVSQLTKKKM